MMLDKHGRMAVTITASVMMEPQVTTNALTSKYKQAGRAYVKKSLAYCKNVLVVWFSSVLFCEKEWL